MVAQSRVIGSDPTQLRELAKRLQRGGEQLQAIRRTLSQLLGDVAWRGQDADAMRADWSRTHRASMQATEAGLREAARQLIRQADEQEQASANDGQQSAGDWFRQARETVGKFTQWAGWSTLVGSLDNINEFRGRDWANWNRVNKSLPDDWFNRFLDRPVVAPLREFGDKAGPLFTTYSLLDHGYTVHEIQQEGGDFAGWAIGNEVSAGVADVLKVSKVGYPYGMALASVTAASSEFQQIFAEDGFSAENRQAFVEGLQDPWVVKESLKDTALFIPVLLGKVFL